MDNDVYSLQDTLPVLDPAGVQQIQAMVAQQGQAIAAYQEQLANLQATNNHFRQANRRQITQISSRLLHSLTRTHTFLESEFPPSESNYDSLSHFLPLQLRLPVLTWKFL